MNTSNKEKYSKELIKAIKEWKENWYKDWKSLRLDRKNISLYDLIFRICIAMNIKGKKAPTISEGEKYSYWYELEMIMIDRNNPSIISMLHEFAHHLYGHDEIKAQLWASELFKKCFLKDFKKLKWENELLIKI